MIIFNKGINNNDYVLVQNKDIKEILYCYQDRKNELLEEFKALYNFSWNSEIDEEFVRFDNINIINFFKEQRYLFDYSFYRDCSLKDLEFFYFSLNQVLEGLEDKYNDASSEKEKYEIKRDMNLTRYIQDEFYKLISYKNKNEKDNIPCDIDYSKKYICRDSLAIHPSINMYAVVVTSSIDITGLHLSDILNEMIILLSSSKNEIDEEFIISHEVEEIVSNDGHMVTFKVNPQIKLIMDNNKVNKL